MSRDPVPHESLYLLIDELITGELSGERREELTRQLNESVEARDVYFEYVTLHGLLKNLHTSPPLPPAEEDWLTEQAISDLDAALTAAKQPVCKDQNSISPSFHGLRFTWSNGLLASSVFAVAGLLFWGMGFFSASPGGNSDTGLLAEHQEPQEVAFVTGVKSGSEVISEAEAWQFDRGLEPGQKLLITSGFLRIQFKDGAEVVVAGPASLTIQSKSSAHLAFGKLVARLKGTDSHLSLSTPLVTVTDLGTAFGVEVGRDGSGEVHVFDGEVEVQQDVPSSHATEHVSLSEGEALSFSASLGLSEVWNSPASQFAQAQLLFEGDEHRVLADLRQDFEYATAGQFTTDFNDGKGLAAQGEGHWTYYSSAKSDPSDPEADLSPLQFVEDHPSLGYGWYAGDYRHHIGYSAPHISRNFHFPLVSARPVFVTPIDGENSADEIVIHPDFEERLFPVVRWTAPREQAKRTKVLVKCRVRMLGFETKDTVDGIRFAMFHRGKKLVSTTVGAADNVGKSFRQEIEVVAGDPIDFVIGCRDNGYNDSTGLTVKIVELDF